MAIILVQPSVTTPTQISRTINSAGTSLTMLHSQAVSVGSGGSGGFTVSLSGGAATLTYASGSGTTSLVYTISRTVNSGETGTISYTQPGNGIEGTVGGVDLASFSTQTVTNNSTQGSGVLPLVTMQTAGAGQVKWDLSTTYLGAFRMPGGNYGSVSGNNLNYSVVPSIAIGSASNRIVMVGRDRGEASTTLAEFSIPTLVGGTTLSALNISSNTQGFIEVLTNAPVDGQTWSGRMIGGIANVNGKLVVNAYGYYDFTNRPTMVIDNISSLSTSTFKGYFDHTDRQHSGGWVTPIPSVYQSALGGSHIFGFSMSGRRAILTKYSIGPSAYIYDFNASDSITGATPPSNGSTLTPTKVLDYPYDHGLTPIASMGGSGTNWTFVSGGQVGLIIPGTRTYMVLGTSAGHVSGCDYYDPAPYDSSFKGYAPNNQNDIYNYIWLYDVDDLIAVKNGTKLSYNVAPYEYGPVTLPFDGGAGWFNIHRVQGMVYDPTNGRLYISLERADNSQATETPLPLVICFDMTGFV